MAKEFHFTTENPERLRWAYLARSCNQSEHRIRFILPADPACHIISYNNRLRLATLNSHGYRTPSYFIYYLQILFLEDSKQPYNILIKRVSKRLFFSRFKVFSKNLYRPWAEGGARLRR